VEEMQRCRALFAEGDLKTMELEVFGSFLEKETVHFP
jgi:hypothetical protein